MFKVLCINNKSIRGVGNMHLDMLEENKNYTVVEFEDTANKVGKYHLKEVESPGHNGWSALRFIPLSDIDETEMERNYNFDELTVKSDR